MKTFSTFVPQMEIYSIDEAFLDMSNMELMNPANAGGNP